MSRDELLALLGDHKEHLVVLTEDGRVYVDGIRADLETQRPAWAKDWL